MRADLSASGARELFSGTSGHHPFNLMRGFAPQFVMRGGFRF